MPEQRNSAPTDIVTVTSRDYLPGTWVMLHSFLRTNPWFTGEVIVLQDDLTDNDKAALQSVFQRISFPAPSQALTSAIDQLVSAFPDLASRRRRFLSLDAFRPERAGQTLFLDSDLLFQANIDGLLELDGSIIACGDRAQIMGHDRDPASLQETTHTNKNNGFTSFNAGLMVINPQCKSATVWDMLLGHLSAENWRNVASDHTDQAVYNRQFGRQVSLANPAYNYLVGHAAKVRSASDVVMNDAKVLHFNGPAKPWTFTHQLDAAKQDAGYIKALRHWQKAYAEFLATYHFTAQS